MISFLRVGMSFATILGLCDLSGFSCPSHASENREVSGESLPDFGFPPLVANSAECSGALQRIRRLEHRFFPASDFVTDHVISEITRLTTSKFSLHWIDVQFMISHRRSWIGRPGDDQILQDLVYRASSEALGQAFAFAMRASSEFLRPTLLAIFRERISDMAGKGDQRAHAWAFLFPQLAATIPLTHLSQVSGNDGGQFWLRSTVVGDEPKLNAQAFPTFLDGGHYCGACPQMFTGFMEALGLMPESAGERFIRPVYVSYGGIVIGVIKVGAATDTSFLSLRTILDDSGRAPLVFGGVYGLKRSFAKELLRKTRRGKQPLRLDVSRLETRPRSMLLNFSYLNDHEIFRRLIGTSGHRYLTNLSRSESDGSDRWHAIYWDAIGARLRARREEIQKDLGLIQRLR